MQSCKIFGAGGRKMKIEVLGSCCSNCAKLYENAVEAVKQTGKQAEVVKVEDLKIIMGYGVLSTPSLVIDGVVKVSGRVPKVDQIKEWIK
jgi:small redox-active disulfide protein 2